MMMEQHGADTTGSTGGGHHDVHAPTLGDNWNACTTTTTTTAGESAMAVEFVASLFRPRGGPDDDGMNGTSSLAADWNVTFPGLSLQPPSSSSSQQEETSLNSSSSNAATTSTTTRHAAEAHAVNLLRRPLHQNQSSWRENAYDSFCTLVQARLNAYVRRWPALAACLLQYRMHPTTLLSRLEVLQQQHHVKTTTVSCQTNADTTTTTTSATKLAVCCWSMAMDLILELPAKQGHDTTTAHQSGHKDNDMMHHNTLPTQSPVISVSFSTLGSISKDSTQGKHLIVDLDLHVLLSEMIRQASTVVSAMVKLVGKSPLPPPRSNKELPSSVAVTLIDKHPSPVINQEDIFRCDDSMPPPPPRRKKRPAVMVVSPDLTSSTAHSNVDVPTFLLGDSSLSVDQCADIIDTCLTEFTPMMVVKSSSSSSKTTTPMKRTKFLSAAHHSK